MATSYENYISEKCNQYDAQGRVAVCIEDILAKMPDKCSVLDAGCGTGNYMVPLICSDKVEKYTGFDASLAMLQCTQNKINAMGRNTMSREWQSDTGPDSCPMTIFQHSLHDPLPFEDNTFDIVLHNQVIHHVVYPDQPDPLYRVRAYLAEFHRVLKPGGLVSMNVLTPSNNVCYWWATTGPAGDKMVQYLYDTETTVSMLSAAGFDNITHHIVCEPLLGEKHFQYEQCFSEEYRKADSGWAQHSEEELGLFLEKMRVILGDERTRKAFDEEQRRNVKVAGATTQIYARK